MKVKVKYWWRIHWAILICISWTHCTIGTPRPILSIGLAGIIIEGTLGQPGTSGPHARRATGCMPGSILPPRLTKGTSRPHTRSIIGWPPCQNFINLTKPHVLMVHIRVTLSHFLEKKFKNVKGKISFGKIQGTSILWNCEYIEIKMRFHKRYDHNVLLNLTVCVCQTIDEAPKS